MVVEHGQLIGEVCGLEVAQEVDAEIKALGLGRVLSLVSLQDVQSIDRPAREFFMDRSPGFRAVALVAGSAATRMIANFFLGLKRSDIPVKMFTDDADASTVDSHMTLTLPESATTTSAGDDASP